MPLRSTKIVTPNLHTEISWLAYYTDSSSICTRTWILDTCALIGSSQSFGWTIPVFHPFQIQLMETDFFSKLNSCKVPMTHGSVQTLLLLWARATCLSHLHGVLRVSGWWRGWESQRLFARNAGKTPKMIWSSCILGISCFWKTDFGGIRRWWDNDLRTFLTTLPARQRTGHVKPVFERSVLA